MFVTTLAAVVAALATATSPAPAVTAPVAAKPLPIAKPVPALKPAAAVTSLAPRRSVVVDGGDVGWPNCPPGVGIPGRHGYGLPMPLPSARFVVIGATNGPAFEPSRCFRSQVRWARSKHLYTSVYSVVSYPTAYELSRYGGSGSLVRRLQRVGAAEARQTLITMRRAGLRSPMVWVDVETVGGHPWSGRPSYNNALLSAVLAEYKKAGVRVGIYSYRNAWNKITGGKRLTAIPTWVPSGLPTRASAAAKCASRSFSGGPVLMAQWTDHRRDYNMTCPGRVFDMTRYFVKL